MKKLATPFRVGLLTLVSLAAFAYLVGSVKEGVGQQDGYEVFAIFDDVSGLLAKSRVQIAGITVGQIQRIELAGERAKVTLRVTSPLYQDAKVVKKQASLLGDYYLVLVPGNVPPVLKDGDEIRTVVSASGMDAMFGDLEGVTADIREVTKSLRAVIGGTEGENMLRSVAENLAQTTQAIRESVVGNQETVNRTLINLEKITSDLSRMTGPGSVEVAGILQETHQIVSKINELLGERSEDLGQSVGSLREAMAQLNENLRELKGTLEHARSISEKIDTGEGTLGKLINDPHLHQEVDGLVTDVGDFVSTYTKLQTIVGLRSEYSFLGNSMKHYVSVRLQPRADKYYLLEVIDDPRGSTTVTSRTTRSDDPTQTALSREEVVETTDSLKISLQLAKRYHFLTGRFGIIEGSGGVGADASLLGDNLELGFDLFDFGLDLNPRLKLLGTYQFFSHLYLAAGADDLLNGDGRDYFFGGGLRFTDEDLKSLLSAAPSPGSLK